MGVTVILLGSMMLVKPFTSKKFSPRVVERLSKFMGKRRFDLFLYGIIYGAAAAGCTRTIFISTMLLAVSFGNLFSGVIIFFLFYVMGMMGLMVVITMLIVFSAEMLNRMKMFSKYIEKIGGILLIVGGLIVIYYVLI